MKSFGLSPDPDRNNLGTLIKPGTMLPVNIIPRWSRPESLVRLSSEPAVGRDKAAHLTSKFKTTLIMISSLAVLSCRLINVTSAMGPKRFESRRDVEDTNSLARADQQFGRSTYYDLVKLNPQVQLSRHKVEAEISGRGNSNSPSSARDRHNNTLDQLHTRRSQQDGRANDIRLRPAASEAPASNHSGPDIETIEAMLEVLDEANKRLLERRLKLNLLEERRRERLDFDVVRPATIGQNDTTLRADSEQPANETRRLQRETDSSFSVVVERDLSARTGRDGSGSGPQANNSNERRPIASAELRRQSSLLNKRRKKLSSGPRNRTRSVGKVEQDDDLIRAPKQQVHEAADEHASQISLESAPNGTQFTADRYSLARDHNLVKPGFEEPQENRLAMDFNRIGRRDAPQEFSSQHTSRRPEMVWMDPMGGVSPAGQDNAQLLMQTHRPITAQDLLHIRPQQRHQAQQPDRNGELSPIFGQHQSPAQERELTGQQQAIGLNPGPLYVSSPVSRQSDSIRHYSQRLLYPAYALNAQNNYNEPEQRAPASADQDRPQTGRNNDDQAQNSAGVARAHPMNLQHYAGHPLLEPLLRPGHPIGRGPSDRYGELAANELGRQTGEPLNPFQHLLEAARNQQAAALSYERRRLDYELELRRREEQMRREHEANLERQRAAAKERAAKEAAEAQRQQQQQANGGQQPEQQQQTEQENGAQNQSDNNQQDDGNGENQQQDEDPNDQRQNEASDDPELKSFQNFAADTDFTDLFPPGVLSKADIEEMRRQQERQRQEQEEQDERDGNREQQRGDSNEQPADKNEAEEQNPAGNQQQNNVTKSSSDGQEVKQLELKQTELTRATNVSLAAVTSNSNQSTASMRIGANATATNTSSSLVPNNLPSYMFRDVATDQTSGRQSKVSNKSRRSNEQKPVPPQPQSFLLFNSGHAHQGDYSKPFPFGLQSTSDLDKGADLVTIQTAANDRSQSQESSSSSGERVAGATSTRSVQVEFDDSLEAYPAEQVMGAD